MVYRLFIYEDCFTIVFQEFESIEIYPKILFQIDLIRGEKDPDFGFNVEAELAEDTEEEDELCAFISDVTKGGLAHRKGKKVITYLFLMFLQYGSEYELSINH